MIFLFISVVIPILIYTVLPEVLKTTYGDKTAKHKSILAIGCLLFFISWYLPSPLIDGQNTSFMTHFVGGGLFAGFVWLYVVKVAGWKPGTVMIEAVLLYALVSSLGVLNELAELFMVRIGLAHLALTDTSWDLLANTLGAAVFYVGYRLIVAVAKWKS